MKSKTLVISILLCTAIVCVLTAWKSVPIGIPGEWVWRYADVSMWGRLWAPALAFEALLLLVLVAGRIRRRWQEAALACSLLGAAFAPQVAFCHVGKGGIQDAATVTMMPAVSGYHACAVSVSSPALFLRHYASYVADMELTDPLMHVCQHPPGPVLYHWVVNRFFELRPSWGEALTRLAEGPSSETIFDTLGMTLSPVQRAGIWGSAFGLMLSCGLTALLACVLGKRLFGWRAGAFAAVLTALIPSLCLFSPYFDQTYSVFALLTVWLALKSADTLEHADMKAAAVWAGLAGMAVFAGMFCGTALVVVAGMSALVFAIRIWGQCRPWRQLVRLASAAVVGFSLPLVVLHLGFGCNMLDIWAITVRKHETFYAIYPRSYWKWLGFNLVEFALFAGIPTAVLGASAMARVLRRGLADGREQFAICASFVLVMVTLSLAGKNLSEVARLWMFLMPFVAVCAGAECRRLFMRAPGWAIAILLAQFCHTVVFKACLDVFGIYSPPG